MDILHRHAVEAVECGWNIHSAVRPSFTRNFLRASLQTAAVLWSQPARLVEMLGAVSRAHPEENKSLAQSWNGRENNRNSTSWPSNLEDGKMGRWAIASRFQLFFEHECNLSLAQKASHRLPLEFTPALGVNLRSNLTYAHALPISKDFPNALCLHWIYCKISEMIRRLFNPNL